VEESSRRGFARYVHVKNWNFLFYCSNIAKSENTMLWRMLSRLETCIVYSCIWSLALAKSIVPRKTWRKLWHSYISKLFLTKMQVKFSIFVHYVSLNVIEDKFRFVISKLKSRSIYKLSIFSFSCLRRLVLIVHIANAWGDLLVLLIIFCKIYKLTLLSTKLINTLIKINYSLSTFRRCQDSRERGKGDWHWLFTKNPFRYRLLASPPMKRTKTSSSTPNLISPSIRHIVY
jgi:hypothetical protein